MSDATAVERPVHAVLRGLVAPEVVAFLCDYTDLMERAGGFVDDQQVGGSANRHGDAAFDTVLERLLPVVAERTGRRIVPTYSFVRRYRSGQELTPHVDRGACEFSLTLHLAASDDAEPWPIWLRHGRSEPERVLLEPGDALLYEGPAALHWRDPLVGSWYLQAFLHYVDADGPHSADIYDGRPALGVPK